MIQIRAFNKSEIRNPPCAVSDENLFNLLVMKKGLASNGFHTRRDSHRRGVSDIFFQLTIFNNKITCVAHICILLSVRHEGDVVFFYIGFGIAARGGVDRDQCCVKGAITNLGDTGRNRDFFQFAGVKSMCANCSHAI